MKGIKRRPFHILNIGDTFLHRWRGDGVRASVSTPVLCQRIRDGSDTTAYDLRNFFPCFSRVHETDDELVSLVPALSGLAFLCGSLYCFRRHDGKSNGFALLLVNVEHFNEPFV